MRYFNLEAALGVVIITISAQVKQDRRALSSFVSFQNH